MYLHGFSLESSGLFIAFFLAVTPLRERYLQRNILFIRKKGEPINSPSSDPVGIRTQDLRLRRSKRNNNIQLKIN